MTLTFEKYIVNREEDFIEQGIEKIKTNISIIVNVIGNNNTNQMVIPIEVINLNSQTGVQMDDQRLSECLILIQNY